MARLFQALDSRASEAGYQRQRKWLSKLPAIGLVAWASAACAQTPAPQNSAPPRYYTPSQAELERFGDLVSKAFDIHSRDASTALNEMREAMSIYERSYGPDHPETAGRYYVTGWFMYRDGWLDMAASLLEKGLDIEERIHGAGSVEVADYLELLSRIRFRKREFHQAEQFAAAAVRDADKSGSGVLGVALRDWGMALGATGRQEEADAALKRSRSIRLQAYPDDDEFIVDDSWRLEGENLLHMNRLVDADEAFAKAARVKSDNSRNAQLYITAQTARARIALDRGAPKSAEDLLLPTLDPARKYLGAKTLPRVLAVSTLGAAEARLGRPERAVSLFREGCFGSGLVGFDIDGQTQVSQCLSESAQAFLDWAADGGGRTLDDSPQALKASAFEQMQTANASAAGYSLASLAARVEASARNGDDAIRAYEIALAKRSSLEQEYADTFASGGPAAVATRSSLFRLLESAETTLAGAVSRLASISPSYWDLQTSNPLEVGMLQSSKGQNAKLLRGNEALVAFLIPSGDTRGWVFAISRERFAVARLSLNGSELRARIGLLRRQIDPDGYSGGPSRSARRGGKPAAFDRQIAYGLYQALLGDPAIIEVIGDKPELLFVPSGSLTSLPPGILITEPPDGGVAGDSDPIALRKTAWLLRSKAITILPEVSSLRLLRQVLPQRSWGRKATDPLVAFADPDFAGPTRGASDSTRIPPATINGYYIDGLSDPASLRTLPRLEGTAEEAEALRGLLRAPTDSVHVRADASEAEVRRLQANGALARARVVEFATHGLLLQAPGSVGLAQPALALAAPASGSKPDEDDGLLTVREIASLRFNADWVILSACNTAAPDREESLGLSGLMSAFFSAGARAVVVSQWRLRDDVAASLVPDILGRFERDPSLDKAQALQLASLAVLDDIRKDDRAFPSEWATFSLVGDAAR